MKEGLGERIRRLHPAHPAGHSLSEPVRAAVEEAVKLVESLVEEINGEGDKVRPGR